MTKVVGWQVETKDRKRLVADEILVLVDRDDPIKLEIERSGVRPGIRVILVAGIPPREFREPPEPFDHEFRLRVYYTGAKTEASR